MASKNLVKIVLLFLLFAADRLIKDLIILKLPPAGVLLLPGVGLKLYFNSELAFSLPVANWLAAILSLIALLATSKLIYKHIAKKPLGQWGLGLLIIGSLSNLLDRLKFGGVIDWLNLWWPGRPTIRWPAFNLSDFYIFLACLFLLVALWRLAGAGRKE